MVAMLTRALGFDHLQLAEDAMQEALLKAVRTWGLGGVPRDPSAWLMRVAKNCALDVVRRETNFRRKEKELIAFFEQRPAQRPDAVRFEEEIRDDQLRLIFACCHPDLPRDAQVALTLKSLCGFGEKEIAAAFSPRRRQSQNASCAPVARSAKRRSRSRFQREKNWRRVSTPFCKRFTCSLTKATRPPPVTNWCEGTFARKRFG